VYLIGFYYKKVYTYCCVIYGWFSAPSIQSDFIQFLFHSPSNSQFQACLLLFILQVYMRMTYVTHITLTLVDLQLDAQNSYLFTYNTFIKILYMFRALPCSSSGGLHRNCICATSGIVTLPVTVKCTG
jgi:hypothetical protein